MAPLIAVRNLNVEFATAQGFVSAVRDISFHIEPGEVLGLVGESGSGKSVTSLAVLRLLPPQATLRGRIEFRGRDLLALTEPEMRRIRGAGISMIFQEPMTALNPVMRVGDQIAEAVLAHAERAGSKGRNNGIARSAAPTVGSSTVTKSEAWRLAVEALRTVAIADAERRARDYPHQFSGGQRQRIGIARALVLHPDFVVCDEPVSALDVSVQAQIVELLGRLRRELGLAYLFISHDLAVVAHVSDRIAVMYLGRIVELGPARAVVTAPRHPYTRALLSAVPQVHATRGARIRLTGEPPSPLAPPDGCAFHPRCPYAQDLCRATRPELAGTASGHAVACHFADTITDPLPAQEAVTCNP